MQTLRRSLPTVTRILDETKGLVEYVASDATLDSYREIILPTAWDLSRFEKNAPFVNSHRYDTIEDLLGRVVASRVENGQLIQTVEWAVGATAHTLAQIGWQLTKGGFLKAVSVGFYPIAYKFKGSEGFADLLKQAGAPADSPCTCIYTTAQQIELSACIIGANPSALAKAYKAGALTDDNLDYLSRQVPAPFEPGTLPVPEDETAAARARFYTAFELARRGL